jgi:hypothetical protein
LFNNVFYLINNNAKDNFETRKKHKILLKNGGLGSNDALLGSGIGLDVN